MGQVRGLAEDYVVIPDLLAKKGQRGYQVSWSNAIAMNGASKTEEATYAVFKALLGKTGQTVFYEKLTSAALDRPRLGPAGDEAAAHVLHEAAGVRARAYVARHLAPGPRRSLPAPQRDARRRAPRSREGPGRGRPGGPGQGRGDPLK